MAGRDTPLIDPSDLAAAMALMTRLPVTASSRGAAAAWAWPLAGFVVALIAGLVGWLLLGLGLTPGVAAAAVLATLALLTGALHEDGLADTADGLFGGADRARRLEIMKDSRAGSYGVLALLLVTLVRWSALTTLMQLGAGLMPLLAAAVLSRSGLPVLMIALPPARTTGLAAATGRPPQAAALLGLAVALALALVLAGWAAIPAAVAAGLAVLAVGLLAQARIGGQTGDVLGAAQQLAEAAVLATLAALP